MAFDETVNIRYAFGDDAAIMTLDYGVAVLCLSELLAICAPARFKCRACGRFMARRAHSFLVAPAARSSMPLDLVIEMTDGVRRVDCVRWCMPCTLSLSGVAQTFAVWRRLADYVELVDIPF